MKTLILSLLLSASAFAQTNIIAAAGWPITIQGITVTMNATQDTSVSGPNYIFQNPAPNTATTTLTSNVNATATAIPLANVANITLGMGLCFSPTNTLTSGCAMTMTTTGAVNNLTMSAGEVMRVVSVNPVTTVAGTPGTVTVVRAASGVGIGSPSTYTAGQIVAITQFGSYADMVQGVISNWEGFLNTTNNCQYLAYTCTQAKSQIGTGNSTLQSAQSVPKTN